MTVASTELAMLTTIDNPFDPFSQWEQWYAYDTQVGHHTCEYLARVCKTSYDLTIDEQARAIDDAINEIIKVNGLGLYKKVYENDEYYSKTKEFNTN